MPTTLTIDRLLREDAGGYIRLEDGSGVLLLHTSEAGDDGTGVPPETGLGGTFTGAGPILGDTWNL